MLDEEERKRGRVSKLRKLVLGRARTSARCLTSWAVGAAADSAWELTCTTFLWVEHESASLCSTDLGELSWVWQGKGGLGGR